jgi:hypothetical protein
MPVYEIDACPCCQSKRLALLPAIISPFLSNYVLGSAPARCSLAECAGCSFRFFNSRLTGNEITKLYSGYRRDEYFRQRHSVEPWYSRKVNDGIAGDPKEIQTRNAAMESFLSQHIDVSRIDTVLDYGGDRGQFIPPDVGKQKFVFELSGAQPVIGVNRIHSDADLVGRHFDLTLLLGVLEHCSEPLSVLLKLKALAHGHNSHIAIGVPYERFSLRFVGSGMLYSRYLDTLLKSASTLKLVDFYSTVFRVRSNAIPPLGIVKCHEHLNFFNEQSITALLHRAEMKVVACSVTQTCHYPVRNLSLNVLMTSS